MNAGGQNRCVGCLPISDIRRKLCSGGCIEANTVRSATRFANNAGRDGVALGAGTHHVVGCAGLDVTGGGITERSQQRKPIHCPMRAMYRRQVIRIGVAEKTHDKPSRARTT